MTFIYRVKQSILLGGDLLSFVIGFWFSLMARHGALPTAAEIHLLAPLFVGLFFLWIVVNFINGLYDLAQLPDKSYYRHVLEAAVFSFFVSVLILYLLPQELAPKTILFLTVIFGYALSAAWRFIYTRFIVTQKLHTRIIIVGYNPEIKELVEIVDRHPERGYKIVALFDPGMELKMPPVASLSLYHSLQALRPAITTHKAQLVVTAPELRGEAETLRELYELLFWPVRITDLSSLYESITGRVPPSTFSEGWFLTNLANIDQPLYTKFRRLLDYVAGLLMSLWLIILYPFLAVGIKLSSPGPIFFRQKRTGQYGATFFIYKFRTMYALAPDGSAEKSGAEFAQKNDERITKFGKFLRKTRLDELPQAFNLLKGDLTFIGPRPERPEIVSTLEAQMPYYALRHMVKPGITGWAAIHQHYTDTMETTLQKLQYDLFYIKNRSILLDLSIVLRTVNVVVRMMGQ